MKISIKRAYEEYDKEDGYRILVDRLWPRGLKKESLKLDLWLKDVAPSKATREAFNHKEENFEDFKKNYINELKTDQEKLKAIELIRKISKDHHITLLYGAKDKTLNQAKVLCDYLEEI